MSGKDVEASDRFLGTQGIQCVLRFLFLLLSTSHHTTSIKTGLLFIS